MPMAAHGCAADTGGTCQVLGCKSWRQAACEADSHKCVCLAGTCAVGGACQATCVHETTGTCRVFGCRSSRGATECINHKCYCAPGSCAGPDDVCHALTPEALDLLGYNATLDRAERLRLAADLPAALPAGPALALASVAAATAGLGVAALVAARGRAGGFV